MITFFCVWGGLIVLLGAGYLFCLWKCHQIDKELIRTVPEEIKERLP